MKIKATNIFEFFIFIGLAFILLAFPRLLHAQACNDGIDNDADGLIGFPRGPEKQIIL